MFRKRENLINQIPNELKIQKWLKEIETINCLLVDYDTRKLFVCWGAAADRRHDDEVKRIWNGWDVYRQNEGLTFHFDYTSRDKSVIEMTDAQFEKYCKENKLLEFDSNL